jgi:hypothetical protein
VVHKVDKDHYDALMEGREDTTKHMEKTTTTCQSSTSHPSYEKTITIQLLSSQPTPTPQTAVSNKAFISTAASTMLKSILQNCKSHNVITAANTIIERHNARTNTVAENAKRTTTEHANANMTAANQNAAIASAVMKTGITHVPHELMSAAG